PGSCPRMETTSNDGRTALSSALDSPWHRDDTVRPATISTAATAPLVILSKTVFTRLSSVISIWGQTLHPQLRLSNVSGDSLCSRRQGIEKSHPDIWTPQPSILFHAPQAAERDTRVLSSAIPECIERARLHSLLKNSCVALGFERYGLQPVRYAPAYERGL